MNIRQSLAAAARGEKVKIWLPGQEREEATGLSAYDPLNTEKYGPVENLRGEEGKIVGFEHNINEAPPKNWLFKEGMERQIARIELTSKFWDGYIEDEIRHTEQALKESGSEGNQDLSKQLLQLNLMKTFLDNTKSVTIRFVENREITLDNPPNTDRNAAPGDIEPE